MNTSKKILVVGQKVNCSLPYCGDGYIMRIEGNQRPDTFQKLGAIGVIGGMANVHIVFPLYFASVPESLVRGSGQWSISDEVINADDLEKYKEKTRRYLDDAAMKRHIADLEKKIEEQRQSTAPEFSHLIRCNEYNTTVTAKNIRAELKKSWPDTKFSVRKEHHSCINVSWTDGPDSNIVRDSLANFKATSGMDQSDLTIYKTHAWIFGTVDYLFFHQEYSDAVLQTAIDKVNARFKNNATVDQFRNGRLPPMHDSGNGDSFYRELIRVLSGEVDYELEEDLSLKEFNDVIENTGILIW